MQVPASSRVLAQIWRQRARHAMEPAMAVSHVRLSLVTFATTKH